MTSDRGLCGGFNTNAIKATERFIATKTAQGLDVTLIPVGRRGRDFFRKKVKMINERVDCMSKFDIHLALDIAQDIIPPFIRGEYDELYLIYNEFRNVTTQRPALVRLFPSPLWARKRPSSRSSESITSMSHRQRSCLTDYWPCMSVSCSFEHCSRHQQGKMGRGWQRWITLQETAMN